MAPKVEHYEFGRIIVDGEVYTNDIIIFPDRIQSSWWREQGHYLQMCDIEHVLDEQPEVLIIGTGAYGVMDVAKEVVAACNERGIELHIQTTAEAVKTYNKMAESKRTVAALHLTC